MLEPDDGRNAGASAAASVPADGACISNNKLETAVVFDVFFTCTVNLKSLPAFTFSGFVENPVTITRGTLWLLSEPPVAIGSLFEIPPAS